MWTNRETVRAWFRDPRAVEHYAHAAASIGLWRSEAIVFQRVLDRHAATLDVGCGAGRIALGLHRLGFGPIVGVDFAPEMVEYARVLTGSLGITLAFEVGDVRALPFEDGRFQNLVFGFNGLMQIPGRGTRRRALCALARVAGSGATLVFTTHDRDYWKERATWRAARTRWELGVRDEGAGEFGDRVLHNPEGDIFMHLPDRDEVLEDLPATGWAHIEDHMRYEIAQEPEDVRAFSDECRFWIARKA